MKEIVAYYRVSTQSQGLHGLGMDAQRASVASYAHQNNCHITAAYEEVETARPASLKNRPALVNAIAHARRLLATLVIARFDRLSRSVLVTSQLLESGVEFVACDNPHANRLTIQILAVMAEHESRMTSLRVKAAHEAARARGIVYKHKNRHFTAEIRARGQAASRLAKMNRTREVYADLLPLVREWREAGLTYQQIADKLNGLGHRNQYGKRWNKDATANLLHREGVRIGVRRVCHDPGMIVQYQPLGCATAVRLRQERTQEGYRHQLPLIRAYREANYSTGSIAQELNSLGFRTQRGTVWTNMTLLGLLRREGLSGLVTGREIRADAEKHHLFLRAVDAYRNVIPLVRILRSRRYSYEEIARRLNAAGHRTVQRKRWHGYTVSKAFHRDTIYRSRLRTARLAKTCPR